MPDLTKRKPTFLCKMCRLETAVSGQCRENMLYKVLSVGGLTPKFEWTNSEKGAECVFNQKNA